MRVAVIFSSASKAGGLDEYAKAVASGIESMGHRVDLLDARTDEGQRLPGYEYLIVVSEPVSAFSGKIPENLSKYLAQASSLVGKKGAAFLRRSGLFSGKAMASLMKAMEKEGMWVNWSETVANPSQAAAAAKRIGS
jgi:menaquinone-dependent protoporphyrinogen IX oxidase